MLYSGGKMVKKIGINFRIDVRHVEKLKKIARERAYKEGKEITYIDLIRGAYEEEYKLEVKNNG